MWPQYYDTVCPCKADKISLVRGEAHALAMPINMWAQ